jgi:hypothetical protein
MNNSEEKDRIELRKRLVQAIAANDIPAMDSVKKKIKKEIIVLRTFLDFLQHSDEEPDPNVEIKIDDSPGSFTHFLRENEKENQIISKPLTK